MLAPGKQSLDEEWLAWQAALLERDISENILSALVAKLPFLVAKLLVEERLAGGYGLCLGSEHFVQYHIRVREGLLGEHGLCRGFTTKFGIGGESISLYTE